METLAKIFGAITILILINVGISNPENISFRFWPFDVEIVSNFGLCLVLFFVLFFIAGGFFVWLNSTYDYKKSLQKAKKRNQRIKRQIKRQ